MQGLIRRAEASGLDRATALVLVLSLALAFLHHADHALRVDHSGWPFRDRVTAFTYSLGAYPVILFALLGPKSLFWFRWALLAMATAFTLYAHTAMESPQTQFTMWAHNRSAHFEGVQNAFGIESPLMGALSVAVGMALNVVAVTATVMMAAKGFGRRVRPGV